MPVAKFFLQGAGLVNEQIGYEETTIDLRDALRVIRKHRYLILGISLVAVVSSGVISYLLPKTYQAEATLRIKQPRGLSDSLLGDLPVSNVLGTKQLMSTYAEILKSRSVIQAVIDRTQSRKEKMPNYEEMLARINTQPVKDTEILKISVQGKFPDRGAISREYFG